MVFFIFSILFSRAHSNSWLPFLLCSLWVICKIDYAAVMTAEVKFREINEAFVSLRGAVRDIFLYIYDSHKSFTFSLKSLILSIEVSEFRVKPRNIIITPLVLKHPPFFVILKQLKFAGKLALNIWTESITSSYSGFIFNSLLRIN